MPEDTYKKHCTKQRSFLVLMTYTVSALIYLMDGAFSQAEFSFIRHERSRIRHSNGKDYTRWGLHVLNNLTFQYESNSMQYDLFENESSILTANDPWLLENITDHSSVRTQYPDKSPEKNTTSFTFLSFLPKNRKNANKKILKNIQKTIDKGIRYLQSHNDLNEEDKNESTHLSSIQIQAPEVEPVVKNYNSRTTAGLTKIEESQSLVENFNSRNNSGVNYEDFFILSNDEYRTQTQMTDGAFPTANQKQEGFDDDYLIQHIEDLSSLDEISRSNRLNLLQGRDVVTKFLQIVESQHMLGANCTAGTALNLGDGVVDQYAQDRFRIEAEVAVNRANMLTRIFKQASFPVQASEHLLHASVLSMVEFDEDIFAAGNCFDWNQHPSKPGLFCPFAYRLPPPDQGAAFAKDLAAEYHYLGNTSEWFFLARKNAEKVIARNNQYSKAYHYYSNSTAREADVTLTVRYEDGRWSKPYYDCGGGNIWMLTFTVPFFGFANGSYFFKGTSGIDIDLRRVDIDQCPQKVIAGVIQPINIFAGTDKCKQRTTMCEPIPGLGFRRGSYKCVCRKGFYFPNGNAHYKYFNGSVLEEEYEKLMLNEPSAYSTAFSYECRQCAEGCDSCKDSSPCVATLNWHMRTSILVLACFVIGLLPPAAWFTVRYHEVKVVRAASPVLLRVIALGAFFIYSTTIVMYPPPTLYTCTARVWLREIGFSLTYGALMLKTWRISVIFRVRSAKAVKITDAALMKRLGMICCIIGIFLLIRTIVSPPEVVVGYTPDDLKTFLCKTDWWDYTFTTLEVLFLGWGVRLCIMVRKAPSEFNESRFISMAIYNEFLLTCFLNVSMMFLQSPANPDLLYIIFFCHTQLTVTLLLGLIFGSKIYIVLRNGKMQENTIGLGSKASVGKFSNRKQIKAFNNPSTATSSTLQIAEVRLSDQEVLDEILQLNIQLQRIQDLIAPKTLAANTVSVLLESIKAAIQTINSKAPLTNSLLLPTFSGVDTYQDVRVCKKTVDKSVNTINAEDIFSHMMELDRTNQPHCPKQVNDIHFITDKDTCVDFSELYLECMCARPDEEFACDADLTLDCKGATEIPTYFQRNKSSKRLDKNLEINEGNCFPQIHSYESQGIADNDEEYVLKKHCQHLDTHKSRLEASQQQIKTFSETNECQVRKQETNILHCKNDNDKPPSQSQKLDKLVLDLNDRSKYTKEVSV